MSDDKLTGVYQIRNTATGKLYVGSTSTSFFRRRGEHVRALRSSRHKNKKLQNAWDKYGESVFVFEILLVCPREMCIHFEQVIMDKLNVVAAGYNISPTAGSTLGHKFSEAARAKLSAANARRPPISAETSAKIAAGHKGKKRSQETRARIAAAKTGLQLSDAHKAKISESHKARWASKRIKEQEDTNE